MKRPPSKFLIATLLVLVAFVPGCARRAAVAPPVSAGAMAAPSEGQAATKPAVEPARGTTETQAITFEPAFFDFETARLDADARNALERNARVLRAHPELTLVIEGHCDERGSDEFNLALGEERAAAARGYLVSLGIAPSRLSVISFGRQRPFATGHDEAAWAQNRRAHLVAMAATP